ncbi:MAG: MFS transporter [Firmicutes bacterium]|jgi:MFS family permease|nr:MFS transporter [Bacillota bacterium]
MSTALEALDESGMQKFHLRTMFTAGMGFFTDAYDLFIIGTVTAILTPIWHLDTSELALLNSLSLAAAAFGAALFGPLMDRFGRKAIYGFEMVILTFGALLSAFAPSFAWLLVFRVIVGIGVGGNYPTSSVITSEYSNRAQRGYMVTMVFAMQGLGLLVGPLVAAGLLASGIGHDLVWRLMLAFGAIPAASVIYLRRNLPESPRFLLSVKKDQTAAKEVAELLANAEPATPRVEEAPVVQNQMQSMLSRRNLIRLIGAAGSWFLIDIAFYGNSVSSQVIMKALLPGAPLVTTVLVTALIFAVAAVPGYFVAAHYMDRLGRKRIQITGFLVMALAYGSLLVVPTIVKVPLMFLVVYAISYFFVEFGPNTTTFLVPSEIFPTNLRGRGHGFSAASGKIGAFVGAFFLPLVLKAIGLSSTMGLLAGVALLGVALTWLAIPEMKQVSLEANEISDQSPQAS